MNLMTSTNFPPYPVYCYCCSQIISLSFDKTHEHKPPVSPQFCVHCGSAIAFLYQSLGSTKEFNNLDDFVGELQSIGNRQKFLDAYIGWKESQVFIHRNKSGNKD